MSRFQKIVIALLVALVVVVGAGGGIIAYQLNAAAAQADYERCMANHGVEPGDGSTIEEALEASEACS